MQLARAMRWIGYVLYAIAGLVPACYPGVHLADHPLWFASYAVLGVALLGSNRAALRRRCSRGVPRSRGARAPRLGPLVVMTAAMIAMAAAVPCTFGALTLAVVASQAALVLPVRAAIAWSAAQTLAVAWFLIPDFGWMFGTAELIALAGFEGFAIAAVAAGRREAAARAEASRAHERERIARDLHDSLGHSLTALALQLELAAHEGGDAAKARVAGAKDLSARLLADVRAAVGHMRAAPSASIADAIRASVVDAPGLAVHLDVPAALALADAARVDCIARCAQEVVTNARRHARAANVWIRVRCKGDVLALDAHDDGAGAASTARPGNGLRGMRERFEQLGGALEVDTARAFAISARLPLQV